MGINSHYTTLDISSNASPSEIKLAYRQLVKKYHPDVNPNNKASEEHFKKIQQAYYILSDNNRRDHYDQLQLKNKIRHHSANSSTVYRNYSVRYETEVDEVSLFTAYKGEIKLLLISTLIALLFLYFIISY